MVGEQSNAMPSTVRRPKGSPSEDESYIDTFHGKVRILVPHHSVI